MGRKVATPEITLVGLDIGFGYTKLVTPALLASKKSVMFPSVWGSAHKEEYQREARDKTFPGMLIRDDDGQSYFVGAMAHDQLSPAQIFDLRGGRASNDDKFSNDARVRFAKTAIGQLFHGDISGDVHHVVIATGLPVSHMADAPGLKKALMKQHCIKTNGCDVVIDVLNVILMPQPYGSIYSQSLKIDGSINTKYTFTKTGVVDVGSFTVDVVLDNDGKYVPMMSGSRENGVSTIHEAIRAAFNREMRETPSAEQIDRIMSNKKVLVRGELHDYSVARNAGLDNLRTGIMQLMTQLWQQGARVDVIYVSGGGGQFAIETIQQQYPQAKLLENSQLANAQGYLQYALSML